MYLFNVLAAQEKMADITKKTKDIRDIVQNNKKQTAWQKFKPILGVSIPIGLIIITLLSFAFVGPFVGLFTVAPLIFSLSFLENSSQDELIDDTEKKEVKYFFKKVLTVLTPELDTTDFRKFLDDIFSAPFLYRKDFIRIMEIVRDFEQLNTSIVEEKKHYSKTQQQISHATKFVDMNNNSNTTVNVEQEIQEEPPKNTINILDNILIPIDKNNLKI